MVTTSLVVTVATLLFVILQSCSVVMAINKWLNPKSLTHCVNGIINYVLDEKTVFRDFMSLWSQALLQEQFCLSCFCQWWSHTRPRSIDATLMTSICVGHCIVCSHPPINFYFHSFQFGFPVMINTILTQNIHSTFTPSCICFVKPSKWMTCQWLFKQFPRKCLVAGLHGQQGWMDEEGGQEHVFVSSSTCCVSHKWTSQGTTPITFVRSKPPQHSLLQQHSTDLAKLTVENCCLGVLLEITLNHCSKLISKCHVILCHSWSKVLWLPMVKNFWHVWKFVLSSKKFCMAGKQMQWSNPSHSLVKNCVA